ncbi:ANTAR domain-containing response regulator [Demetria terragena]|uniref:ANTAR domain-containing response regulator n=1 Tax=Demetria terragena TaxID=63959 RepID=UPI000366455C|nr:response regulator [Demetria terragena]
MTENADLPASSGQRILVVEDEALIRMDLVEMLTESGHTVVGEASNGEAAVVRARELEPDLILMDVKMPGLDGITAAERIGKVAPIVLLTAFSDDNLIDRARDAGVMAYVVKPFTMDDLRPAISLARARWMEQRSLEAEIADLEGRFEARKVMDRAKGVLMSRLGIDEPEAFRWLQKNAMDRRMGMREVAEAVIGSRRESAEGG